MNYHSEAGEIVSTSTARVAPMDIKDEIENAESQEEIISIPELMAKIRQEIKEDVEQHQDRMPEFSPDDADFNTTPRKARELLYSEELRYLNQHYAFPVNPKFDAITSHRPGIIGKLIVKAKRKIGAFIWNLFKEYFVAERDYQANVVRYLNDVSKYVDARDAQNFWELIRKIDVDVTRALNRIDRIHDEQIATLRSTERQVYEALRAAITDVQKDLGGVQSNVSKHGSELETLSAVTSGLEAIVARYGRSSDSSAMQAGDANKEQTATEMPDCTYLMLENRFRGSEQEISNRLSIYPPLFQKAIAANRLTGQVLEIGPGRGELLSLFKEAGVGAIGVDVDRAMVDAATEKGFKVTCGDGISFIQQQQHGLAGVIAVQVVEHLSRSQLQSLFRACKEKVAKGGIVVFETINPRSLQALSSNYFRDPTHVWPLHPDTLAYAMELEGLRVKEVKNLSPVPEEARLQFLPQAPTATPAQRELVERINSNIDQLNELIYGYQDYCIVAEVQ